MSADYLNRPDIAPIGESLNDSTVKALDLDAIELRLRMATPGPWEAPPYRTTPDGPASYNVVKSEHANICGLHDGGQTRERIDANAVFIAHAPTDVAALVAEVRRLRAASPEAESDQ